MATQPSLRNGLLAAAGLAYKKQSPDLPIAPTTVGINAASKAVVKAGPR